MANWQLLDVCLKTPRCVFKKLFAIMTNFFQTLAPSIVRFFKKNHFLIPWLDMFSILEIMDLQLKMESTRMPLPPYKRQTLSNEQLRQACLLLRFRTVTPTNLTSKFVSYEQISKLLRISKYKARKLTAIEISKLQAQSKAKQIAPAKFRNGKPVIVKRFGEVLQHHLLHFTAQSTLDQQAGKTLEERTLLLHRKFPEVLISKSQLWNIYRKNGVKRKVIRKVKRQTANQKQRCMVSLQSMQEKLNAASKAGQLVLWCDETLFTTKTVLRQEYATRHHNITIGNDQLNFKAEAVIATISEKHGLVLHKCYGRSVTKDKFCEYLKDLREVIGKRSALIVLDNLAVHHSNNVVEAARKLHFELCFTPAYSPDLNSIEFIFSKVKNAFRRLKTHHVVNEIYMHTGQMIDMSFGEVTREDCSNAIQHVLSSIDAFAKKRD